jgi:tetratricopeptide (TPR) repeat protein
MKTFFISLSLSALLFPVLPVVAVSTAEMGLAQTAPQTQQIDPYETMIEAQRYFDRGRGSVETGDLQGAIAAFDQSIELNPKDPATFYYRGLTKFKLKDKQGAINDMTTATKLIRQDGSKDKNHQRYLKLIEQFKASLAADKK